MVFGTILDPQMLPKWFKRCLEIDKNRVAFLGARGGFAVPWPFHGRSTAGDNPRRNGEMDIFTKSELFVWEGCKIGQYWYDGAHRR